VADNKGWFDDFKNVEEFYKKNGIEIKRKNTNELSLQEKNVVNSENKDEELKINP
jgi:Iap family predicted aminopeptidase